MQIKKELTKIITAALLEDKAYNDITSDLTIPADHEISFAINARQDLVLCAVDAIKICFSILKKSKKFADAKIKLDIKAKDTDFIKAGKSIATGIGNARLIFAAERTILNLIQHLSAISTNTKSYTQILNDKNIKILDTRKTIPGLRVLQKYAVKTGGGQNHRLDLSVMILIKDNHIGASQGIENALKACKKSKRKIEIECDNLQQVAQAVRLQPDIIMLDNMSAAQIKEACKIINKKCKIEISGGINLENVENFRKLEIDYISIGALTHSVKAVDIGLDIIF